MTTKGKVLGKILAISISDVKGVPKTPIPSCNMVVDFGIENDAHGGKWHRQVSLLGVESAQKITDQGMEGICHGRFAENVTTEGIVLYQLPVGTKIWLGDTLHEVTQIGKECHHGCAIKATVGDCVMPREGIFTRVLIGGTVSVDDAICAAVDAQNPYRAGVIVASDKGSRGDRLDASGELIRSRLEASGYVVIEKRIVPDDQSLIASAIVDQIDTLGCQLVLTTGGTGFSVRDVTPEATRQVIHREVPGIPEAMRWVSYQKTPKAMLSRAVAGIRGNALIVNMPGSPKAVDECMDVLLQALGHGLDILTGSAFECAEYQKK